MSKRLRRLGIDAHRVLPGLYQGSRPAPGGSLRRAGFSGLVLAAEEYQPPTESFPGIVVAHCPLDDHLKPLTSQEWEKICAAADFASSFASAGNRVLVTCWQGINRSGIITAAAVILMLRCSGATAVKLVRNKRPNALSNRSFAAQLASL